MQQLTLTYEQALASLKQAVEERGADYLYPKEWRTGVTENFPGWCVNFTNDGQAACIAGYVYSEWSIEADNVWAEAAVQTLSGRDGEHSDPSTLPLNIDERTYILLDAAQTAQDSGSSWGSALEQALYQVEIYDRRQVAND